MNKLDTITHHQHLLRQCRQCPEMTPPVIVCQPMISKIMLIGQAPGINEKVHQRPFAWTAGKTLFKWFASIGVDEDRFRKQVYMSALCRCFPGKNPKGGGDRVPSKEEIKTCAIWLDKEIQILQPELIIPVGRMAIEKFLEFKLLKDVIGDTHEVAFDKITIDILPLPHPSGASTWHVMQPGKALLVDALKQLENHSLWKSLDREDG